MKEEILIKAKTKIDVANESGQTFESLIRDFDLCLKAAICPTCGCDLELGRVEYFIERGFWIFKKKYKRFDKKVICPNGHKLLSPISKSDRGWPTNCEFKDCVNLEIAKANFDDFDDDECDGF